MTELQHERIVLLEAENMELRAENERLNAENARLQALLDVVAGRMEERGARLDELTSGELAGPTDSGLRARGASLLPELAVIKAVMFGKEKP